MNRRDLGEQLSHFYVNFFMRDIVAYAFPGQVFMLCLFFLFAPQTASHLMELGEKPYFVKLVEHFRWFLVGLDILVAYVLGHVFQSVGELSTVLKVRDDPDFKREKMFYELTKRAFNEDGPHFRMYRERMFALKMLFGNLSMALFLSLLLGLLISVIFCRNCYYGCASFIIMFILGVAALYIHYKFSREKVGWENEYFPVLTNLD